ncbi:helix-turn-helix domain-containing protein [Actinomycetospora endophytica]|uniref:Helix-turn-helix domain-containing protein n=1 Tax=Actinomycetospora endophytica TaxID=2291215 RepID=A0ABS8P9X4_9PSEU|nr:helix-turn-helix domain-containing protein [Actinomycetospora endophytica]MCD2194201.1 helix-turn-helix domain-containing protein [Actinomycetospora endophytica]
MGEAGLHPWARDASGPSLILPDGCLDVIVRPDGVAVVAGPDVTAREYDDEGRHVGVRFSHGLGPLVLRVPADELTGRVVPLADVVGRAAAAGLEPGDDVALRRWVARRLTTVRDDDPWAPAAFTAAAVGTPVATIAARAGLSARTLQRRCNVRFGYGPQHLARVLRLQRALALRRRGEPWASVAADAGYVDQPHLARECRALTGRAPTLL